MPLPLAIVTGTSVAIYRQIMDQICAAILAGRVNDDEPLPSVRALAEQLLINPNTVAKAYGELAREGIIESRAGRGMFVAARRQIYNRAERARRIEQSLSAFVSEALILGLTPEEIKEHVDDKVRELSPDKKRSPPRGGSR
jgi:GntR family transcriptional regulator